MNSRSNPDAPIVKNTNDARQGVTGHNVRYVLIVSLTAVVVAFAAVIALWFR